jgi:hypothetical protein
MLVAANIRKALPLVDQGSTREAQFKAAMEAVLKRVTFPRSFFGREIPVAFLVDLFNQSREVYTGAKSVLTVEQCFVEEAAFTQFNNFYFALLASFGQNVTGAGLTELAAARAKLVASASLGSAGGSMASIFSGDSGGGSITAEQVGPLIEDFTASHSLFAESFETAVNLFPEHDGLPVYKLSKANVAASTEALATVSGVNSALNTLGLPSIQQLASAASATNGGGGAAFPSHVDSSVSEGFQVAGYIEGPPRSMPKVTPELKANMQRQTRFAVQVGENNNLLTSTTPSYEFEKHFVDQAFEDHCFPSSTPKIYAALLSKADAPAHFMTHLHGHELNDEQIRAYLRWWTDKKFMLCKTVMTRLPSPKKPKHPGSHFR